MDSVMGNNHGTALSYLDMLSGGAFCTMLRCLPWVLPRISTAPLLCSC